MKALILIFSILCQFSEALQKPTRNVIVSQNKKTAYIRPGQNITVVKKGNPTTGYEWNVDFQDCLKKGFLGNDTMRKNFKRDENKQGMVGVGGTYYFKFPSAQRFVPKYTNTSSGTLKMVEQQENEGCKQYFTYARSWEKDLPPSATNTLTLFRKSLKNKENANNDL